MNENIEQHLDSLAAKFPEQKILAGGLQFKINEIKIPPSAALIKDIEDFKQEMEKLESENVNKSN